MRIDMHSISQLEPRVLQEDLQHRTTERPSRQPNSRLTEGTLEMRCVTPESALIEPLRFD